MGAELIFEKFGLATEAVKGTAETAPTRLMDWKGKITPKKETYRPKSNRGTTYGYNRSKVTKRWAEWEGAGDAGAKDAPIVFTNIIKGGVSATTPAGATNARQYAFVPTASSDDLKTSTMFWGDPNIKVLQGAFGTIDEVTIGGDTGGGNAISISAKGRTNDPVLMGSAPTFPACDPGSLMVPLNIDLWIDTSSAIGTTSVNSLLASNVEVKIVSGRSFKFKPGGASGTLGYGRTGRQGRWAEVKFSLELDDATYYNLWKNHTSVKLRVRFNGDLIETVSMVDFFEFIQFDLYGPLDGLDFAELESTNRIIDFTVISEVNAGAGYDWSALVQCAATTL